MAVDFFLAIGMNAEAETIRGSLPESAKRTESPQKRKPSRSPAWIGAAIISFLCLLIAGIGAFRFLSASKPTETSVPATIPAATSSPPVEATVLPIAEGMVKITSGAYEVGVASVDEYHSALQSISLNDFWIDQYQTTNEQYQKYLSETGAQGPQVPGKDKHPVMGVTWEQAVAYCSWANKRLPTEAEWEVAGRGPGTNPQLYPWGNDPTAGGKALNLPNETYEVGSQPFNVSPLGIYDMVGNVWEWVGEPYASAQEGYKILRGGRFSNPQDLAYRLARLPDDKISEYAGFRCTASQVK